MEEIKLLKWQKNLAKSIDPDEVAHNEPPHLDLCCLPMSHLIWIYTVCLRTTEFLMIQLGQMFLLNFAEVLVNFVIRSFGVFNRGTSSSKMTNHN